MIRDLRPAAVILATGATPWLPEFESDGGVNVVDGWEVLRGEAKVGAGTRGRLALRLDRTGRGGTAGALGDSGSARGERHACGRSAPLYVRDDIAAELHRRQIPVTPDARLYGCDGDTVFMQHTTSDEPIIFEGVDTLVLCHGHKPETALETALRPLANGQADAPGRVDRDWRLHGAAYGRGSGVRRVESGMASLGRGRR